MRLLSITLTNVKDVPNHTSDESANVIGDPFRWQVTEIEPIKADVTEHQAHTTLCKCGCQTSAKLPAEIVKSNFGPRFAAIIAYLTAVLHASRRGTCEFCITFLGIQIALGSIQNLLEDTGGALAPIDDELKDALPKEPVLNADETGWLDRWLWVFVAPTFIYFQVAKSRGHQVLVGLLGTVYNGILCVDRWGAYCTSARKNGQKKVLIPPHLPVELSDPPYGSHSEEGKLGEQFLGAHHLCPHPAFDHIPEWA